MNLIEHWGSGIPRIISRVRDTGLRDPEFLGGDVDLRVNIYRGRKDDGDCQYGSVGASHVREDTVSYGRQWKSWRYRR